jgi:hypothetical protein
MYRQGLGDCFLLTFDPGGSEVHMLIDCGTLGATTTGNTLKDVVEHIRTTTGDHLHLVVATHEHQDHVSGFHTLKEVFKDNVTVDNVWMAWTENPEDKLAQDIEVFKGQDLGPALAMAAEVLVKNRLGDPAALGMGRTIQSLLEFSGDPLVFGAAKLAPTVDSGMTFVRTEMVAKADYHKPGGAALEPAFVPGFRFYVLGPPYSEARLRDLGDHGSAELYGMAAAASFHGTLAATGIAGQLTQEQESEMPFDPRFRCGEDDPLIRPSLDEYFDPKNIWRRVDNDWLHAAVDLALQLDSMTNNTSLALAIERISDGKVLLFPADAQQGHWLSWHEPETRFTYKSGGATKEITAEELLKQTVFYKVGHHGSHNATAKGKGLEMMEREDDLVAFIPLDRQVALSRNPKGSWKMPALPLYRRLLEKCQGRVARSDTGWADDAKNATLKPVEKLFEDMATGAEWTRWRTNQASANVVIDPLFIDFTLT